MITIWPVEVYSGMEVKSFKPESAKSDIYKHAIIIIII
ncbi:hypothetical protein J2Z66_003308 [Paenibacillus eucommiae]|uniref:Uncharacterized protein n=1 Tax=Paenibacillus eucommiae TaxID=1355755 RepID=A0ABS4IVT1_9BACL|nr:hypothetical protein [Paenibacillus eucommiae]